MRLFLGVDGGQSSTTALIGDETGRVLGYGQGGPCNHVGAAEGRAKFTRAIEECLGAACAEAGLEYGAVRFESAYMGFSGGPADKQPILAEMLQTAHLAVSDDALIALSGATAGAPGLIVIGGTGSIAFGRNAGGRTARAGGWGYIFGDEGGGFDITRQALRAALEFEEGWGPATSLRSALLEATGARDANELMHRFYTTEFPRPRIAALSKLVDTAASAGDVCARDILTRAGLALARFGEAVRSQLFTTDDKPRACYIGGAFRSSVLRAQFTQAMEAKGAIVTPPSYGPAAGALIEAYRAVMPAPELHGAPLLEKS